jgi:hypothetical protein
VLVDSRAAALGDELLVALRRVVAATRRAERTEAQRRQHEHQPSSDSHLDPPGDAPSPERGPYHRPWKT